MMNGVSSGAQRPISAAGNAHASEKNIVTAMTTGISRIHGVGATLYATIRIASRSSAAVKPTASVQTLAKGISDLSNAMFVITERRRSTARIALMMVIITS